MQTEQKRLLGLGVVVDNGDGAVAQKIGQVTVLLNLDVTIPKIVGVCRRRAELVRVIVERAAAKPIEVIIAALQRAEVRKTTQVPFPYKSRAVTGLAKK
jgi:hypothetical protein